ncbi:MAG: hypothetical protein JWO44_68 [Bacteroidetes bacterium]|jgi:hypothetical protein|nr:hypothetical protein [Bacteroidota bacterium]
MHRLNPYTLNIDKAFHEDELLKGVYLVVLHASRIPPHIGLIAGKKYHSLTIKGQETDHSIEALLKNIRMRKIPSLFIKIKAHPVFSNDFLKEHFIQDVQQFPKVSVGGATCLSPVKLFFEKAYEVPLSNVNYLFELLPELEQNKLVEQVSALNSGESTFQLPVYDLQQIHSEIRLAEQEAKQIKQSSLKQQA